MDDVAVDAKRILLRYGAPISVLDDVSEVERIELARLIAKTSLPAREKNLRQVLADRGYMEPPPPKTRRSRAKTAPPKTGTAAASPVARPGADGKGAAHNQKPTVRQRATGRDAVSQKSSPKSRSRKAVSFTSNLPARAQAELDLSLADRSYMEPPPPKTRRSRAKTAPPKTGTAAASPVARPGADGKGAAHNQKPTARQRATGRDAVSQRSSPKSRSRKAASSKSKSLAKRTSKKSGKPARARSKVETRKSSATPRKTRAKSASSPKAAAKRTARPKSAGKKSTRAGVTAQSRSRSKGSSRAKQGRKNR